ncbi:MAG TPA: hypothetical protein VFB99_12995 [Vicinamibacterales bacterium]|jgi:hypothetical protein|nr:hypothetical protein [Vicinamibacterales bacterium]
MASAKTMASDTPGYLRIMRNPSFTSSQENTGVHGAYMRLNVSQNTRAVLTVP